MPSILASNTLVLNLAKQSEPEKTFGRQLAGAVVLKGMDIQPMSAARFFNSNKVDPDHMRRVIETSRRDHPDDRLLLFSVRESDNHSSALANGFGLRADNRSVELAESFNGSIRVSLERAGYSFTAAPNPGVVIYPEDPYTAMLSMIGAAGMPLVELSFDSHPFDLKHMNLLLDGVVRAVGDYFKR